MATLLAKVRPSVLLISTDPAHNLSDAFGQKFGKEPTLINGYDNLFAMEIDPSATIHELAEKTAANAQDTPDHPMASLLNAGGVLGELSKSIPGIDEAMGFAEIMKLVKSMDYSVIVFDTAPTGHTLRFLHFPQVLDKGLGKIGDLMKSFGGMFQSVSSMLFPQMQGQSQDLAGNLQEMKRTVEQVIEQFEDNNKTTFIPVCISEFLSLYETERLVSDLNEHHIDTHNIVVNQLIPRENASGCGMCASRRKMQDKYLDQILELYDDFHIVQVPLGGQEIRGKKDLEAFADSLINPSPLLASKE